MNPRISFGPAAATTVGTNQCGSCRELFNSLAAFDAHR